MFIVAIRRQKVETQIDALTRQWMGQHYNYKGLKKTVDEMEKSITPKTKVQTTSDLKKQWRGLAAAIRGLGKK